MEDKKITFCRYCGEKYDTPVKFCRKCGKKLSHQVDQNSNDLENDTEEVSNNNYNDIEIDEEDKKISKKLGIILSTIILISIIVLSIFGITNKVIFSSERLVNNFKESCNKKDVKELKEILVSERTGEELEEDKINNFLKYLENNPSIMSEICNDLKSLENSNFNNTSTSIYIRKVDGIWGKLGKKEIVLKEVDIKIYVPEGSVKILLDNNEYDSKNKEWISIDSLYVGEYELKAEYVTSIRKLEESLNIQIDYGDYQNEYVMFDYVKSVTVYTEYSDAYLVINGVSTSKTISDLNYTVYPVKSDDKISLEYKVDDEIFSSNSIIVGDNNSLYFNELVGLDNYLIEETYIYNFESNLERSVRELIQAYSRSFAYAINYNSFDEVSYILYPGSNIYTMQQEFINSMSFKDYYLYFVSLSIKDVKYDPNTRSGSVNVKEVYDTYLDGEGGKIEQNYIYTFKYNDNEKSYQFTDMKYVK